jgi:hypothetical protein
MAKILSHEQNSTGEKGLFGVVNISLKILETLVNQRDSRGLAGWFFAVGIAGAKGRVPSCHS